MKTFTVAALAAAMIASATGSAPAQYFPPGYDAPRNRGYDGPRSRDYDGPYGGRYYGERRSFGGGGYYRPGRFRTWNGCQPGWTVQDGLCKPYRGY